MGLIPAHAGSTDYGQADSSPGWAHPRSRGEHVSEVFAADADDGSSPLTRGALDTVNKIDLGQRLIPAHAGSTVLLEVGGGVGGAHPRSRGEHVNEIESLLALGGSSPLTRGAPGEKEVLHDE